MSSALILDSLEIKNFRAFRQLRIGRLGRVNLIVGKNSTGKTALLEALWLYASQDKPQVIRQLLNARDEGPLLNVNEKGFSEEAAQSVRKLFFRKAESDQLPEAIQIGPENKAEETVFLQIKWMDTNNNSIEAEVPEVAVLPGWMQVPLVKTGEQKVPLSLKHHILYSSVEKHLSCVYVPASGLSEAETGIRWDNIALTALEEEVVKALQIITPELERLSLIHNPYFNPALQYWNSRERIPMVKLTGADTPLPLRNLGEGLHRLFGLALALAGARGGLLLIDEAESGLHYSVQPNVWRLIFETARRLNVQVFATTHSWDCIEAFQRAAQENEEEGVLIRLVSRDGEVAAKVFDEEEVGIATRQEIELR